MNFWRILWVNMTVASVSLFVVGCGDGFSSSVPQSLSSSPNSNAVNPPSGVDDETLVEAEGDQEPIVVDRSNPRLSKISVEPENLDPLADNWLEPHQAVLDTRVEPQGILVLFLIGAGGGTPLGSDPALTKIASYGFHVIAPDYAQDYGIGTDCNGDSDCRGEKRLEAFEGVDHSEIIQISRANSIEQRLTLYLRSLAEVLPEGGWGYFLDDQLNPRWDRIYVVGISHGASTAALIGKVRPVARVVSFSGPLDIAAGNIPASWLLMPAMTPPDRYYMLSHEDDSQFPGHLLAWGALNVPGNPTLINADSRPPYGNSHRLRGTYPSSDPHSNTQPTVRDIPEATVLEPVWKFLLGVG